MEGIASSQVFDRKETAYRRDVGEVHSEDSRVPNRMSVDILEIFPAQRWSEWKLLTPTI
jgi:hypothetical protein